MIVVVETRWDNAPISYLFGDDVLFATRDWLFRNLRALHAFLDRPSEVHAEDRVRALSMVDPVHGPLICDPQMHVSALLDWGLLERAPSFCTSCRYLVRSSRKVNGLRWPWRIPAVEAFRGLVHLMRAG